ncbi:PAS domain S-box-containing protein [Pontibacter aydingkolensis]|uniref:histidine kinase n=1 Tax=Pontibacter aydingkolensis TaxID=1911536 RepID=A0ABS7CX53_9BACT|nr:PAS domain-containing sensor histidine kinase [Pontibacter aydingkolensis]MBW7468398.1 PAS domain-containing sensor histidine kinase [Pontibacter aydingkolensis]
MSTVLHIGLHQKALLELKSHIQDQDVMFKEVPGEAFREVCKTLQKFDVLLVGENVEHQIQLAQEAYSHDKTISVLLFNDSSNHEKMKQALRFSPFIGPTVQCVSSEAPQRIAPIVEDALQRTKQRRSFTKLKNNALSGQHFAPNVLERVRTDFTSKVLEEAPIGAVLLSDSGIVFSMNNYALGLFGKMEKEVLGTPLAGHFPEKMQDEIKHFLLDGYLSDPKQVFEIVKPGEKQYLEFSVAPIDRTGTSNYKLVIINNITQTVVAQQHTQAHLHELETLNANLARVNADLDTFVYTASHDLKSPILNIEGLISSLEEELGPAKAAVAMELEHIKRSINRFKQTVEDLTEVSRVQKSFGQEAMLVDVAELLEDVKQLLEREIRETGVAIELHCSESIAVLFPKHNLTSILYNLLNNAIKYRSPDRSPHIQVKAWRDGKVFYISVKDNGLGIPKDKRDRVFQLFKRMHSHVVGSGVGLYLVKRIVEYNGGNITVESEEGVGSVFEVQLKEV